MIIGINLSTSHKTATDSLLSALHKIIHLFPENKMLFNCKYLFKNNNSEKKNEITYTRDIKASKQFERHLIKPNCSFTLASVSSG